MEEARANAQAEVEAAQAAVRRVEAALEEQMQYLSMAEKEVCYIPWDKGHSRPSFQSHPSGLFHILLNETDLV